jgi:outer membrane protein OmpA-like peptidoglycan-associated protein
MNMRTLIAATCLFAGVASAGDRPGVLTTLDGFNANWPDAALQAHVVGERQGEIVMGEKVAFAYEAAHDGYAAIVHVSSHAEMILARGGKPQPAKKGQTDSFQTSEPLGTETVYVLFSDEPLDALFSGKSDLELGDTRAAAEAFSASLGELRKTQKIAMKRLQYLLVAAAGTSEHTTRGIVRHVEEEDEKPETRTADGGSSRAIPEPVEFALNSAELTPRGKLQLDIFGEAMLAPEMVDRSIVLGGHTDDSGEEAYNCGLSMRRAESARRYLMKSFGISADRLPVAGYGEARPIVPNDTDADRQKNRRVEFTFSKPNEKAAPVDSGCRVR